MRATSAQVPGSDPVSEGAARAGLDFVGRIQAPTLARRDPEDLDRGNLPLGTSEDLEARGSWEHQSAYPPVTAAERSSVAETVDAEEQRTLTWPFRDKGERVQGPRPPGPTPWRAAHRVPRARLYQDRHDRPVGALRPRRAPPNARGARGCAERHRRRRSGR